MGEAISGNSGSAIGDFVRRDALFPMALEMLLNRARDQYCLHHDSNDDRKGCRAEPADNRSKTPIAAQGSLGGDRIEIYPAGED